MRPRNHKFSLKFLIVTIAILSLIFSSIHLTKLGLRSRRYREYASRFERIEKGERAEADRFKAAADRWRLVIDKWAAENKSNNGENDKNLEDMKNHYNHNLNIFLEMKKRADNSGRIARIYRQASNYPWKLAGPVPVDYAP